MVEWEKEEEKLRLLVDKVVLFESFFGRRTPASSEKNFPIGSFWNNLLGLKKDVNRQQTWPNCCKGEFSNIGPKSQFLNGRFKKKIFACYATFMFLSLIINSGFVILF